MDASKRVGQQAIVLGGSIAGLLTARVLADHFERVIIIERDPLAGDAQARKGVPQGRQTHGLLAGGLTAIETLLPGTRDDLVQRGAVPGDVLGTTLWHVEGQRHVQFESGLVGILQSRPLLEQVIRQRTARLANVELRDSTNLERLIADGTDCGIVGVEVTCRRNHGRQRLDADLVVDATGRGSRMPSMLKGLGFESPQEESVQVDLAYATRTYRRKAGHFGGNLAAVVTPHFPNKRFGVALAMEDDRWSLTLGGMCGERPPTDPAAYHEFAGGLSSSIIHDFLQTAEPLSEIVTYQFPASLRRRYERLSRFPEGLLVLGDAMCSFNPVYGQGMTTAALQAIALADCLKHGTRRLARRFFSRAAKLVDVPWQIAVSGDLQFPEVPGRRSWMAPLMNAYMGRVHVAASRDRSVALAFHRVANLLAAPTSLFRPAILGRVLAAGLSGNGQRPAARRSQTSTRPVRTASPAFDTGSHWNLRVR